MKIDSFARFLGFVCLTMVATRSGVFNGADGGKDGGVLADITAGLWRDESLRFAASRTSSFRVCSS